MIFSCLRVFNTAPGTFNWFGLTSLVSRINPSLAESSLKSGTSNCPSLNMVSNDGFPLASEIALACSAKAFIEDSQNPDSANLAILELPSIADFNTLDLSKTK